MTPRDLPRHWLDDAGGRYEGRPQVVPAQWIERSTTPMVDVDETRQYGY